MAGGNADVVRDPRRLLPEAIEFKADGDDGVVVRPDRARLVVVWIVSWMIGGERANAPPGPHVRRHQPLHDFLGALRGHDPGPKAMPSVRSNAQYLFLLAIERIGV